MTTTIKVTASTRARLSAIAKELGMTQDAALGQLLDDHEMARAHTDYARLEADADEWADYTRELHSWDVTVGEGIASDDEIPEQTR